MLKQLRYNMKKIIWILVFVFCIGTILLFSMDSWVGSGGGPRAAAIVNGEEVSLSIYYKLYSNYDNYYRQIYKENFDMIKNMLKLNPKRDALNQLIQDTLLVQKAKDMGLGVSDDEIIGKIKLLPIFQTNGQFDARKWNNIVKNTNPNWVNIEENTRRDLYVEKIRRIISDSVKVSEDEVYDYFVRRNEQMKVEYAFIKPGDFVVEEDAKKYYEEHKDEFMQKEQFKARHILIKVKKGASESKKTKAKEKIDKIYKEIQDGGNFVKLAFEHSEDEGSKEKGGDLGYFGQGSMVKVFEEAVMKLKEGEVSPPVLSPFGYHIIKLEAVKEAHLQTYDKVKSTLKRKIISDKETTAAKAKAQEFIAKAKAGDFKKEAGSFGFEYDTSGYFTREGSVPGKIGYDQAVSSAAFELKQDEVSLPVESQKGIYVLKVIDNPEVDNENYKKEHERFKTMLVDEKKTKVMEEFYKKLKGEADIEVLIDIEDKEEQNKA